MLLGIPGDNTYSNLAEASRIFWRSTVLPLANRLSLALSHWLSPAYDDPRLCFKPDIDSLEALSSEREALRASLEKTSFLTVDEKRAAIGYGPKPATKSNVEKGNPWHVPAGNGRISGQFTSAPGSGAEDQDVGGQADNEPKDQESDIQLVSDGGRPVDLLEEEAQGGHAIKKHVGKSESFLTNRVLTEVYRVGMFTYGLESAGSFPSLEAANKLVNSTLSANAAIVERVANGHVGGARLVWEFGSVTGYEAHRKSDQQQPIMRSTTGVEVLIRHDSSAPNGFRIVTAYPKYMGK